MRPFEDELRKALSRREPGDDFTAQVLARVKERKARFKPGWLSFSWQLAWATALLLVLVSGLAYRQHLRDQKGQEAKRQLLMAMQIAGSQLHQAQLRVRQIEYPEVVAQ